MWVLRLSMIEHGVDDEPVAGCGEEEGAGVSGC